MKYKIWIVGWLGFTFLVGAVLFSLSFLPPQEVGVPILFPLHHHEPDAVEINKARYSYNREKLIIKAESDFEDALSMTVSVSGPNDEDPFEPHFIVEMPMDFVSDYNRFKVKITGIDPKKDNLDGRRVSVQTSHGGVYNEKIR